MTFSNLPIDIDALPRLEDAPLHPVQRRYAWLGLAVTAAVLLTLGGIARLLRDATAQPLLYDPWLWRLWAVAALILPIWVYFSRRSIAYGLRQHDLHRASGLLFRRHTVQPLARLQHVEEYRGPLERWLGLSSLRVFSAGHGSATFVIPGLTQTRARTLRSQILAYGRG